jgi:acetylglutamate kinase
VQSVVVKIGGSTLGSHDTSLGDLIELTRRGLSPVVVHGGGSVISTWLERQGSLPRFVRGLRVTDAAGLEVVTAVLGGLVNTSLVAGIVKKGGRAVGLSGADDGLFQAEIVEPELGQVGSIVSVNTAPVLALMERGYIPVVAPVSLHGSSDPDSELPVLNVNADTAAGELAKALGAQRLIFLTDVEGVLDSSRRLISRLSPTQARRLITSGVASGGMIPKLEACLRALDPVTTAQIIDGRGSGALLEAMEDQKIGTRIE